MSLRGFDWRVAVEGVTTADLCGSRVPIVCGVTATGDRWTVILCPSVPVSLEMR